MQEIKSWPIRKGMLKSIKILPNPKKSAIFWGEKEIYLRSKEIVSPKTGIFLYSPIILDQKENGLVKRKENI